MKHSISAVLLSTLMLLSCSELQVETTPTDRFQDGTYSSYSWRLPELAHGAEQGGSLQAVAPLLRQAVDRALQDKGYTELETGGDLLVDYQFEVSLVESAQPVDPDMAGRSNPVPNTGAVINRGTDPALADNAYALNSPREMNRIVLQISEGGNQQPLWAATLSQVVENSNEETGKQMRKGIVAAVNRALGQIPNAP